VTAALNTWEDRITLTSVEVADDADPAVAVVTISYLHRRDGSQAGVQLGVTLGGP